MKYEIISLNKTFKMKFIIFFVTISFGTIFSRETFVNGSDDEWIETNCELILDYRGCKTMVLKRNV